MPQTSRVMCSHPMKMSHRSRKHGVIMCFIPKIWKLAPKHLDAGQFLPCSRLTVFDNKNYSL